MGIYRGNYLICLTPFIPTIITAFYVNLFTIIVNFQLLIFLIVLMKVDREVTHNSNNIAEEFLIKIELNARTIEYLPLRGYV